MTLLFGHRESFAIVLQPLGLPPPEPDPSGAVTWAALQFWVGNQNLSAHTHLDLGVYHEALHWPVIHFVRWVTLRWSEFFETQTWPIRGTWNDARDVCEELDALLVSIADTDDPNEEERIIECRDAFVQSHSLMSASGGGLVPDLYFSREGGSVTIAWAKAGDRAKTQFHYGAGSRDIPAGVFHEAIRGLMSWCLERLSKQDDAVARSDADGIRNWLELTADSNPAAAEESLFGYIGVSKDQVFPRLGTESPESFFELESDWRARGALFDASRSAPAMVFRALAPIIQPDEVIQIIRKLSDYPRSETGDQRLSAFRHQLGSTIGDRTDHGQGYALAVAVREQLGNTTDYLDIEQLLQDFGVSVVELPLSPEIDGGCVWDSAHGPLIILNPSSKKAQSPWGRRMVLAHELCHLLLDRREATPLKVMSGSWAPSRLERRANAFGAELLLPKLGILKTVGVPNLEPIDDVTKVLMDKYMVGWTTCINHVENRFRVRWPQSA
jgi:hypothetical protein